MPSLLLRAVLWVSVVWSTTTSSAALQEDAARKEAIDRYLASRNGSGLACLYTFDRFRASVNVSSPRTYNATDQDAADDHLLVTIPPTFEEHVGEDCPFGDLQFDPELVTSVRDANSTSEQGVHLSEDPQKDVKRPQIASNDAVPAKDFYTSATKYSEGFSFEFSYRRRVETNQTMTLFSIGNRFGSCVDPGFRVDLISTHVIMVNYFIPVLMGNDIACYERRLFSASIQRCVMPRYRSNIDDNPVVHVIITLDPTNGAGALRSRFFLKYVDPVTMEGYECSGRDSMKAPDEGVEYDYIQGTYRLFIGNNPRNVSSPLKRSRVAPVRQYRDPDWDDRPAEERLRDMIKQKLNSLTGPRLPASFRLFGGKSLSMSFFTVSMPPVNEDTPFKWARNVIADFKKEHGDDIVDFIIKSLRDGKKEDSFGLDLPTNGRDHLNQSDPLSAHARDDVKPTQHAHRGIYPNANGSTFDIFHFAVYRKPVAPKEVEDKYWSTWMTPLRPFMGLKRTVRIHEDQEVELDLLQLHSVFNDVKLEITQLPELGKVLLYPSKTVLTPTNLASFRDLPMDQQQKIYFKPNPRENNNNIKGGDVGRRLDPYSVIRYRVWNTTTGRTINATHEVSIEIWVDPIQRTSAHQVIDVDVFDEQPAFLDLRGVIDDEASNNAGNITASSRRLGLFDALALLDKNLSDISGKIEPRNFSQVIQVLDLPRYGRLYDRRMENVSSRLTGIKSVYQNDLEPYRIRREWMANRTFSTSLVYIHDTRHADTPIGTVDILRYQVRAAASSEYSAPSTVKLHLMASAVSDDVARTRNTSNVVAVIEVDTCSAVTVALSEVEIFQLDPTIQFKMEELPSHGKLYQYHENPASPTPNASIGSLIHSRNTLIGDVRGRVVYAPDPNYFNLPDDEGGMFNRRDESLDSFAYTVATVKDHDEDEGPRHTVWEPQSSEIGMRFIQIQVAKCPGTLTVLPPTVFSTNSTRGEPVRVPIIFDDPDGYSGPYRVTLKAEDSVSEFELGHAITDDVVLKYCAYKRPCSLIRSANESFSSNDNDDEDERDDWQLRYRVNTRSWNPSHIEVEGFRTALDYSLQKLVFRDRSLWTWYGDHTSQFEVSIERSNTTNHGKTKMRYYIDFASTTTDGGADSLGQALSNLIDFVSMGLWVALVYFVLSSASCCSSGFCCCCTRARTEKRHKFEEERRRYVEQVAQNDREYSSLLMSLATTLSDPDVEFPETLLRSCGCKSQNERTVMQLVCMKSLTPVLEADFMFVKLVTHLASKESQDGLQDDTFAYPSLAGLAMAHFCNEKGEMWLRRCLKTFLKQDISHSGCAGVRLLAVLEENIDTLPDEIVHLCQRFADVVSKPSNSDRTEAIHVVFFNHFIGPVLWFMKPNWHGVCSSRAQRRKLRLGVQAIMSFGNIHQGDDSLMDRDEDDLARYRSLLLRISTSSSTQESAFGKTEYDCDLIGACLMNLHSILEKVLPTLEAEEKTREKAQESTHISFENDEDVSGEPPATSVIKIKRLLRTLNFPITSCEALVSSAECEFSPNWLLWNGFSRDEWRSRVGRRVTNATRMPSFTTHRDNSKAPKLRHAESLLVVDVDQDEDADLTAFEASQSCESSDRGGIARVEFEL